MRTQADRDFDLQSGREIERKDAEIARLTKALNASLRGGPEPAIGVDRWLRLLDENENLRAALTEISKLMWGDIDGKMYRTRAAEIAQEALALEQKVDNNG